MRVQKAAEVKPCCRQAVPTTHTHPYDQGDHLSGKPGNVKDKILSWKSVPKLFIT